MTLNKNMGTIDRIVRLVAVVIIVALYFTGQLTGLAAIILAIVAVVLLLTSIISWCPAYLPFGISTCKKEG